MKCESTMTTHILLSRSTDVRMVLNPEAFGLIFPQAKGLLMVVSKKTVVRDLSGEQISLPPFNLN